MAKMVLLALFTLGVTAGLAKDAPAKGGEDRERTPFTYPGRAATTKEILNTGLMLQNKDGSLTPYVPEHTTLKHGDRELFFVWEMNPFGGSAVWLRVQGYLRTKKEGWVLFLSDYFDGVGEMTPVVEKDDLLVLKESGDPKDGAKGTFYARRLSTITTWALVPKVE